MDDDDEDIFQKNIISRYILRPTKLEHLCLASFAANYTVSKWNDDDEETGHVSNILDEDDDNPDSEDMFKKITLRDNSGTMNRRKRQAIIRFRKFNVEKEQEEFCRAKLMLFLPWRDEEHDLIKVYQDFTSHYRDVANEIREQESMFTANLESTYNAMEIMDQHGAPEHAWDQIAPGNLHNE